MLITGSSSSIRAVPGASARTGCGRGSRAGSRRRESHRSTSTSPDRAIALPVQRDTRDHVRPAGRAGHARRARAPSGDLRRKDLCHSRSLLGRVHRPPRGRGRACYRWRSASQPADALLDAGDNRGARAVRSPFAIQPWSLASPAHREGRRRDNAPRAEAIDRRVGRVAPHSFPGPPPADCSDAGRAAP